MLKIQGVSFDNKVLEQYAINLIFKIRERFSINICRWYTILCTYPFHFSFTDHFKLLSSLTCFQCICNSHYDLDIQIHSFLCTPIILENNSSSLTKISNGDSSCFYIVFCFMHFKFIHYLIEMGGKISPFGQ